MTLRGEAAWTLSDKPLWGGMPLFLLTFSAEYIKTMSSAFEAAAVGDQTEGVAFRLMLGEAKKKGQWQASYMYKDLEADASWDAIADSDCGCGDTDRRDHALRYLYNLQDWWQL